MKYLTKKTLFIVLWFLSSYLQAQSLENNLTIKGNKAFAIELYKQLNDDPQKNIFISPYSISSALAMTYAGAQGKTAQEIAATLRLAPSTVHQDFQNLSKHFNQLNRKGLQLSIANALWCEKSVRFLKAYLGLTKNFYQAKAQNLDFKKQGEKSRSIINQWVEDQTQQKIKDLLPKGAINAITRLVLTNAIYFKGQWQYKFKKSQTRKMDFLTGKKTLKNIQFMRMQRRFKYAETEDLQMIELPYKDNKMSMVVLLPKDVKGINKLSASLTTQRYQNLMDRLYYTNVKLSLPKFKLTLDVNLKDVLKKMGMHQAFSDRADFSRMTGDQSLQISEVIHKAFVEVNEKGTEAAAATAVIVKAKTSATRRPRPPKIFKADHPFMFVIKDSTTGSILFMGKLNEPK